MPYVGFEPAIPASKPAKTVHVLDRSATMTGAPAALHLVKEPRYALDRRLGDLQSRPGRS
jgi:hypothetical protein